MERDTVPLSSSKVVNEFPSLMSVLPYLSPEADALKAPVILLLFLERMEHA
jgi:hypothetical protein